MLKNLLSVILLFFCLAGQSQTTLTIGTGAALTADHQSGPIYRSSSSSTFDYSQYAYLYTASELTGITSGTEISKLAWNKTNTGATTGGGKFKIYMKNSGATSYTVATAFSTLISGATLVYDNSNTVMPATAGFQEFVLATPFVYSGGSIEIMVDWDISAVAGNPSTADFSWQKTTVTSKILGYANSSAIINALSPTNNSIADITNTRPVIKITYGPPAVPCSGTPDGGIIAAPDSVCAGVSFALSVTGATTGVSGLSYQWQSSTDSISWTNTGTTVDESLVVTQNVNTFYRRIVSCTANSDTSTAKITKIKSALNCICIPASSDCSLNDYISNVTFGTLNNTSSCTTAGYIDYSGSVAAPVITPATSVNMSVTVGNGGTEYVAAWIDFNQNGVFEPSEYTFIGSGTGTTVSNSITIPADAVTGLAKMRVRVRYNATIAATDNCTTFSFGETEDYYINILPLVACSGTPTGGTTVANVNLTCPADSIILSVNNSTTGVGNLTYQWQSSTDATIWTDIPGETNTTCIVYQDAATYYQRLITCSSNTTSSTPILVGMTPSNLCYCKPDSSNCNVTADITNVHFAALNNTSTCSFHGYGNYTGLTPTAVQAGLTLPISISSYSVSSSLTNYFIIWIDYNHNGVFDSSEHTFLGTVQGTGSLSGTIHIPADATPGITGMRVRAKFNSPAITGWDACTTFGTAETEDYFVNILPASSCSNGLTAGTITGPYDICNGFDFDLSSINTTVDAAARYAWQSSTDSLIWTNINNTNIPLDHITVSQTATTWYRLVDSCSTTSAISNVVKVIQRSSTINCHCTPPGSSVCTIGDLIIRVHVGTIDTTSYCSPNGYGNFVNGNQTTTFNANSSVSMSVQVGCATGNPENVAVWIDFNQNGIFEANEFTYLGYGCGSTITGNVSIPSNALSGQARMRVRVTADGMMNPGDACTHYANGETEDYRVTISPYSCPVNTWTGAFSNTWENALNWSCNEIPGVNSCVAINSGTPIISSNVTIYSINVNSGATLTVNPGFNLTVTH